MKTYRILKTFDGNQTGNGEPERFEAGSLAALSDWLAETAVKGGLAEALEAAAAPEQADETPPADARETKVDAPEETKPARPAAKKGKK